MPKRRQRHVTRRGDPASTTAGIVRIEHRATGSADGALR
jgi:hypothetical protein